MILSGLRTDCCLDKKHLESSFSCVDIRVKKESSNPSLERCWSKRQRSQAMANMANDIVGEILSTILAKAINDVFRKNRIVWYPVQSLPNSRLKAEQTQGNKKEGYVPVRLNKLLLLLSIASATCQASVHLCQSSIPATPFHIQRPQRISPFPTLPASSFLESPSFANPILFILPQPHKTNILGHSTLAALG